MLGRLVGEDRGRMGTGLFVQRRMRERWVSAVVGPTRGEGRTSAGAGARTRSVLGARARERAAQ